MARLGKWLAFSDYPSSILRSNLKEGFFGLKLSLSISKLCFSDAASYYDNFNMTKNKSHRLKHYHWQRWVNLSFYLLGATLVYNDGSNQNKWWWFLLVIKTKFKLPLYNFNCIGYLSEILVIILTTRRTQRRMIQATTCTYGKILLFPIFR